jgi:uncharacterized membrane protein YbaN (DUF454 family)
LNLYLGILGFIPGLLASKPYVLCWAFLDSRETGWLLSAVSNNPIQTSWAKPLSLSRRIYIHHIRSIINLSYFHTSQKKEQALQSRNRQATFNKTLSRKAFALIPCSQKTSALGLLLQSNSIQTTHIFPSLHIYRDTLSILTIMPFAHSQLARSCSGSQTCSLHSKASLARQQQRHPGLGGVASVSSRMRIGMELQLGRRRISVMRPGVVRSFQGREWGQLFGRR